MLGGFCGESLLSYNLVVTFLFSPQFLYPGFLFGDEYVLLGSARNVANERNRVVGVNGILDLVIPFPVLK